MSGLVNTFHKFEEKFDKFVLQLSMHHPYLCFMAMFICLVIALGVVAVCEQGATPQLAQNGMVSDECTQVVKQIASQGGTPLVVAKNHKILGVIHLKDIIKHGVKEKFADLRKMGIKTIMITGDNPVTAAAIAAEASADDYLTNPFSVEELLARLRENKDG